LVIEQLEQWQQANGKPGKTDKQTSAAAVVAKSLRYLSNNQGKMKYDQYRQQGLLVIP
jgi:hypothetical protein